MWTGLIWSLIWGSYQGCSHSSKHLSVFGIDCHFHHIHLSAQVVDERRFLSICPAVFIDAHFTVSRTVLLLNTFPSVSWWTTAYFDCLQFCAIEILLFTYSFTYSVILSYSNTTKRNTLFIQTSASRRRKPSSGLTRAASICNKSAMIIMW